MAEERLIFPIGFDLEGGVKEVEKDWPSAHKRLQKMVNKTPLTIKLNIDMKGLDLKSLKDYNKLTKEATLAAKRAADVDSKRALARKRESEARVAEATEEARILRTKANAEMAQLRLNDAQQNGVRSANQLNAAYSKQSTYLQRLLQRMGVYVGLRQFASVIRDVREITAEFELQRVSLGALIQDSYQANVLFSKIKAAAVESPYQIKELVNYTKQLAAYGVEQNKLFGTVMQYADVAAGLGADMSRIILAMGQIRAASVLKGTELRQLTELGIPMVELLSEKLSELKGEFVSAGEVFSMISDKAISFRMVEEIFDDLTGAGGRFYDMQKKQAETLAGQWSNLKDTISIMYEEMGNTESVRGVMESWIEGVKSLADNWELVAGTIWRFVKAMLVAKGVSIFLPTQVTDTRLLRQATNELTAATARYNAVAGKGIAGQSAKWAMNHAKWMMKAANATTIFGRSMKKIAAFFAGGGWLSLAIMAISALVSWLISARKEANRLNEDLAKIASEGAVKMEQAARNFERLAKVAVESVDGTKEQTDALKELQRTYGDIIPSQDLSIEKLREMKNNYDSITQAIREKIAMQTLEQKVSAIQEEYGGKIAKQQKKFKEYLEETAGLSSDEAIRVINNIQRQILEGSLKAGYEKGTLYKGAEALKRAIAEEVFGEKDFDPMTSYSWSNYLGWFTADLDDSYKEFATLHIQMENAIKGVTSEMEASTGTLGKYTNAWNATAAQIKKDIGNITISKNTKLYEEEVEKAKIKNYTDFLKQTVGSEVADFDITKYTKDGVLDLSSILNIQGLSVQAKNAVRQVMGELQGLDGWKKTIQDFSKDITVGGIERKMALYTDEELGNFGNLKTALEDVAKKWKDYDAEVTRYTSTLKGKLNPEEEEYTKNKKQQSEELKRQAYEILKYYNALDLIEKMGKGTGEDEWIILMKNRASFMKDFQQGVEALSKKMMEQEALFKEQGIMASRGISVGYDVSKLKGSAAELSKWYEDAIKEVAAKVRSLGSKEGFAELSIDAILKKDTKTQLIKEYQNLLQWLFNQKTDFETKQLEESLKKEIDRLAKAVSRSKEAQDFYDKMLGMTGDRQLSADLTMSVYGGLGDDLKENIKKQLEQAFKGVDISDAISGEDIDYKSLEKLIDDLPEDMRANARKVVEEGISSNAAIVRDLYKTLVKFEDYEDKRMTILRNGIEQRKKIEEANLAQSEKDRLKAASKNEEDKALAKLDYEQFKSSDMYITMFENLDYVSANTLKRMKERLLELKTTMGESLDPTQLKEIVTKIEDIDAELSRKNPFKTLSRSIQEYKDEYGKIRKKSLEKDLLTANKERDTAKDDADAKADAVLAQEEMVRLAEEEYGVDSESAAMQRILLEDAKAELTIAKDNLRQKEKTLDNLNDQARAWRNIKKAVKEAIEGKDGIVDWLNSAQTMLDSVKSLGESMGAGEEFSGWMEAISGIIGGASTTATGIGQILSGDIAGGIANTIKGLSDFALGIFDASYVERVAIANAEIQRQERLLSDLGSAYERLETAMADALGSDYIANYNSRIENLKAQAEAYQKQADAERDKGKEADEEAITEYESKAREANQAMEDMVSEVSERFLGTDLTSAARDFAQAWMDAYKEFSSTTDAMKDKFSEMVENMIVESLAAKVIEGQLGEIFDMVDTMSKDGQLSVSDAAHIAEMSKLASQNIDVGMTNLMNALEAAGISVRGMGTDLTGISKDIATASEESILGLAAGINTQNFYISQVPPKLDTIIAILQGGGNPVGGINVQDLITIQNQHLAYLPNIATNTLNTADRCERAAVACESALSKISSVISVRGTASTHVVNTN